MLDSGGQKHVLEIRQVLNRRLKSWVRGEKNEERFSPLLFSPKCELHIVIF